MTTTSPHISKDTFVEILQDKDLVQPDDLLIFQTLYSLDKQEASATDLARIIGWSDKNGVVGKIVGLGKRILKKYDIKQREREDGTKALWDFFFSGYYKGTFFIYQLKPELKEALEECGLTENIKPISLQNAYLFVWNPNKWSQWTDRYERNVFARNECLKHYGYSCSVCDFNFEKYYGSLGYKFIHVHHLTQVATRKQEYKVDPIQDLRPVCPNCHSMLHKQNPPLTIDELKSIIKNKI